MSDVNFSDHFIMIFHYSFLKAARVIYYLLTHNNPPPLIGSFYGPVLSDGGHLSVTRMQFFLYFAWFCISGGYKGTPLLNFSDPW